MTVMPANRYHRERAEGLLAGTRGLRFPVDDGLATGSSMRARWSGARIFGTHAASSAGL
jgi:hypothetical protein